MKAGFQTFISCYFLFFIAFFPISIGSLAFQKAVSLFLFQDASLFIGEVFLKKSFVVDFSSDSISMYILMMIFVLLSFLAIFFIKKPQRITLFTQKVIPYYIAIILLKYGADKVFKSQFYQPEPNILFTNFGDLDQDILYWSVMGVSRSYSVVVGLIELSIALLLLINKTRTFGLLLAVVAFFQIILINFSFDISVKLFSVTLFFMCLFALGNFWKKFCIFIFKGESAKVEIPTLHWIKRIQPFISPTKMLVFGFVFLEIFLPVAQAGNWNDDEAPRPYLHGAYQVIKQQPTAKNKLKYVFFHRDHYIIFMNEAEETKDFPYELDSVNRRLRYTDEAGKMKTIKFYGNKKTHSLSLIKEHQLLQLKPIDWQKKPALQPKFHLFLE